MSEWQIEIINLAKDFRVPKAIYKKIITNTQTHKIDTIPVSYHNNRNRFLYDMAHRKLKQYLWQILV